MINWNNMDTLASYAALKAAEPVKLQAVMAGENGAERVKKYSVPMGCGLDFNFGARPVNDEILAIMADFAKEQQLVEKFVELYNGAVINTGEKRRVLHHMCRGQLGEAVIADGVDKREFYVGEQNKIAAFANKVHNGEIVNAAGEKFTTVCQIGIGGAVGNMVCINNSVAACATIGTTGREGTLIKTNAIPMVLYTLMTVAVIWCAMTFGWY